MRTSDGQEIYTSPLNPLVALQSLLSVDVVSVKQRVKAAQQLEDYFRSLSPTPGLLLSYEPYLPLLIEVLVTGGPEIQTNVFAMLQTLSSHNPIGFVDWIARNTQLGNELWLVQWTYVLLVQIEKLVPRKVQRSESAEENDGQWDDASTEMKEFDQVFVRVMHMWRTLLDHTEDAALVAQLVKYLQALMMQETRGTEWQTLLLKKLQTHFVDIADVFIGWMMSTGPRSLLREEILSLLNQFGRLWADNSVFSLQLLNSFADEIVNLCDAWKDHQEDDDDRLSTLLVSFLMVTQCVPDLALPADEGVESPVVRVLNHVASCPQPKYSLFCLANCSNYLVSLSNCKHGTFPPLSVAVVRFLLYHCAVQSEMHDSEVDQISKVMENACKLASANFCSIEDPLLVQPIAIGAIEDDVPCTIVKKGGEASVKTMECLFQLEFASGVTYITQLCLQLVRVGGIGALKALGIQALRRLSGAERSSYFVFAATCFIMASQNPEKLSLTHGDDGTQMIAILDLFAPTLEKQNHRHRQHELKHRQLCLVLRMACAFMRAVAHWSVEQIDAAESVNGMSLQMLECASTLLVSGKGVVMDHRLTVHLLKVVDTVLLETRLVSVVPQNVYRRLAKAMDAVMHCSSGKVREECLRVFKTLTSRIEACSFACNLLEMSLDLVLDPIHAVRNKAVSSGMSDVARWALLTQDGEHTRRYSSQDLHASFVAADFENVMSLFQTYDCNEAEWNRVCKRIVDRIAQGKDLRNADVLLGAIHQAAGWCVQNRLRTHFGGPAQSFASIERLLQEYSDRMQNVSGRTSQRNDAQLLSNWLLLEFVSALEMRISRAIFSTEEDPSNTESEDHKVALFFRTNKVVCDDWLTHIRPFLAEMSKTGTSYELCRYHSHAVMTTCYSKLSRAMACLTSHGVSEQVCNELRQAEKDMDAALFSLCCCHIDAKDADSIIGFQRWGDSISSALSSVYEVNKEAMDIEDDQLALPLFRWLNAMRYEAEMRYEDAAAEYELVLQPLLAKVEACSSRDVEAAKIFEAPMKYLRVSSHSLLGCFKQCARCYASVREWTKLQALVARFREIAQSLAEYDHPIEGIQAIVDCNDTWSGEMEAICRLGSDVNLAMESSDSGYEMKIESKKRAALALRVWSIVSSPVAGSPTLQRDHVAAGQLSSDLIPLALQPSPWNGYAGEIVGKRAEEIFLRMVKFSEAQSVGVRPTAILTEGLKLNSEVHDSALWSLPFCTPSLSCLTHDALAESADADCLHLIGISRLARKQHNFAFARNLLREAAAVEGASQKSLMVVSYERAKLLATVGMEDDSRHLLETQCETGLRSIRLSQRFDGLEDATTRSFLHLATAFAKVGSTELSSPATFCFPQDTLTSITNLDTQELSNDPSNLDFVPQLRDAAAYKCYAAAITVSPKSAKAWIRYSHWCYDQGKQEIARITEQNGYIHLDSSDEARMNGLVKEIGISEPDRDRIVRAFCRFLENGELVSRRFDVFHQLCADQAAADYNRDDMNRLVQLHRACHSKIFKLYCMSARGYGKYLTVLFSDLNSNVPKQEITMVVLRLLGLLTTYGAESDVVSALEEVFSTGPVTPWSYVVPQLIARAHHPVPAVSSLVCLILKRLAHNSPHAIVYPIVMDSMETFQQEQNATNNSFAAVLQELQNVSSRQVEGVRLLVSELCRIAILWDEAWISTLMKLAADISRRACTLEKEATRVDRNASLSATEKSELAQRKLVAVMKPILVSIEKLWKETCGSARDHHDVSPHERKFLKVYGGVIEKATESFRNCCSLEVRMGSIKTPQELWQPFADILKALMNATGRRDQLPLQEISPAMASTSRELVLPNMPGTMCGQSSPITILRVNPSVAILRTKTKPKSLEFVGSDGKTHKYLLKAREDLRLDERIMQFLRVTNDFLCADKFAAARDLSAQNYSVIPLSRNAGLIQMVPDVVPLFQVHASRIEHHGRVSQDSVAVSSAHQQPPPPTAQFYAKLKQHGITNVSPNNRAQWPIPVLRQVYQELVAQRPRNVLLQEILLRSEDVRESWMKSVRFSKSLAVMSVLGYIVGLGDRHLDNILLCVNSGDVVHIDHNVCFDKGRRLKVPEIVPFRLTPMLQDALGFTGVEGKFRVAFETTLRVVRSDDVREAILTLFEAFVYCPLVDWISEDKRQGRSGDLKARLEVNVNLSLFLSRAEERRQDTITFGRQYEQFADVIARALKEAEVLVIKLLEQRNQLLILEKEEQKLRTEVSKTSAELYTHQSAQNEEQERMEAATTQTKEINAKIASFANECFAKHQQIEVWRQKSKGFAKTDPEGQFNTVTRGIDAASFRRAYAALCDLVAQSRDSNQHKEVLTVLESKCQSLDADVKGLHAKLEGIATCLIPCLCSYSHWRKELDAYVDSELKTSVKDVYFDWWNRCTKGLDEIAAGPDGGPIAAPVTDPLIAPSQESLDYSSLILTRLNDDDLRCPSFDDDKEEESSLLVQVDQLLQNVLNALSAMKLSNAQGRSLLKLAGASWIIDVVEKLDFNSNTDAVEAGAFTPVLATSLEFQRIAAVSSTCSTLLKLASTPKGLMKRLRGNELLGSIDDKVVGETNQGAGENLGKFIDILQAVRTFAIVLQEEFISNLHDQRWQEKAHQDLLKSIRGAPGEMQSAMDELLIPPAASDENSPVRTMHQEHPAVQNVLAAALKITQTISGVINSLHQASAVTEEEGERIRSSSSSTWKEFVFDFISLLSVDQSSQEFKEEARTLWSDHLNAFVSNCLVKLLRYLLSSIITVEWKFDFFPLTQGLGTTVDDEEQPSLSSRWLIFFGSQLPNISPSSLSNDASEAQASTVKQSVGELMKVCEEWWSQQWKLFLLDSWEQRMSFLRTRHERRLRYAAWLAVEPMESTDLAETSRLNRAQLLSLLSSQVPHLNALLTGQIAVEANALELAQQMDYLASNLRVDVHTDRLSPNESLHDCVQVCYTNTAALFDYGRALADLVQGISVIETSSGGFIQGAGQMELEVNTAGNSLLHEALEAAANLQSCNNAVGEVDARARSFQDELEHKRVMCDTIASSKRAAEALFHQLRDESKSTVVGISRELWKHVKEMRCLLKDFDKFKTTTTTTAKQIVATKVESGRSQRPMQTDKKDGLLSGRSTSGYSFMENDRLVKILLRSIRSVNHLQVLETILGQHGKVCMELRGKIAQIVQALTEFDDQAEQLLPVESQEKIGTDLDIDALLTLLWNLIEALRVSTKESRPASEDSVVVDSSDEACTSLLVVGRDLVRGCVKLFFEATEMADRVSSAEDEKCRSEDVSVQQVNDEEEEQHAPMDDSAVESGNSVVVGGNDDTGDSSHDTTFKDHTNVEEKSPYGLQVLKRIEEKLAGTATEVAQVASVLTVEQQASWLIDEATKIDNLCVMYEGWTPWI